MFLSFLVFEWAVNNLNEFWKEKSNASDLFWKIIKQNFIKYIEN